MILAEASRKFQYQTQTLELCKHVISEMIPLFCEAVTNGTMKASAALEEGLGGMGDLLRSVVVYNDDGPHTGFGLSNEAYRLQQEARKSDEWLMLARAIVEAEMSRTDGKHPEAPRAQNSANSAQIVQEQAIGKPNSKLIPPIASVEDMGRLSDMPGDVKSTFTHSEDFRTVTVRGESHMLTSEQAAMIRILHAAYMSRNPVVSIAHILEALEKKSSRWQDTFRSNPRAKRALVRPGPRKGTLRLNV